MTIYFAADHAGFELKQSLLQYVGNELGYATEDCGAFAFDPADDYPEFIKQAAAKVAESPEKRKAIIIGGSGQGEAIAANRYSGVRAVVYYGETGDKQTDADGDTIDMLESTRLHNDANILSLGARFLSEADARAAVKRWLETAFSDDDRHSRRIQLIDAVY